ncbi:MAG TPA: NCS2 family permease [Candidatus Deferrimicrobium sp.]|nr:NCS2 family permease [Candidatus Deferrimicrobium sp.]
MLRRYFRLAELGTSIRQEAVAGVTTFVTMAYIIIVNPKILEAAGLPFGPSMVATILTAFLGTLSMALYAKRPFAIAPYMGENAFIAFTVVGVLGFSWQTALGAVFIAGLLFTLITILKVRGWLANAIPEGLKIGFAVGIGLFLTFIGLNESGIVTLGVAGAPVHVGKLSDPSVILAIVGFLLISFLMIRRITGAILIGILIVTVLAFIVGVTKLPEQWVSMPPSIGPIFGQLDILGALHWGFFAVVLTLLVMGFVDTAGTLIGLSYKAKLLDEHGNLPEIEKPMLCDSLSTMAAAVLGTSISGAFIESATGIEAGGKTGLTSIVTALLFLLALFLAPFFNVIPSCAYGPALMVVGMLMFAPIAKIKFDDLTETIPVFCIVALMSFTYNLGIGMTAGFVVYPLLKVLSGRGREVPSGLWVLGAISLLFFVFYPY